MPPQGPPPAEADHHPSRPAAASGRLRRSWPVVGGTILLAVIIGFIGAVSGPQWNPTPLTHQLIPATSDVGITTTVDSARPGTYNIAITPVEIDLGAVTVAGMVYAPIGAPEGPGVVFMHGAGTNDPDAFQGQVQALASAGIRALIPAKRMDTYSTRERNYEAMAGDYLHSWHFLRSVPGVDPDRVGFYAESEGAWIGPAAAVIEPEVSFLILASAPVVSPREQAAFAAANYLQNTNVPEGMFRAIPRAIGAKIPGGGFEYADFDIRPWLDQLRQPVLMTYGTGDASMPIVQGARIVIEHLAAHGNDAVTVRYYQGADHGLKTEDGHLAPGFSDGLTDWIWGLPATGTAPPQIAGDAPIQRYLAEPVPQPAWYASGDLLVYSAIANIGLGLLGLALIAIAAIRNRATWDIVTRHAVATVLAGFAVIVVFVGYVGQIASLAVNYELDDALVIGGWTLVQAMGLFAIITVVLSLRRAYLARHGASASGLTVRMGWWCCHVGAIAMLIMAAYWGVFPGLGFRLG